MDKQEAKETLQLFRPGTEDAQDPQMAEALLWVQRDEELARWFENHCSVYTAMRRKLQQIPVPEGLQQEILRADAVRRGRIVNLRNTVLPLAAAAAMVLLAVVLWISFAPAARQSFTDYRERMVRQSQRGYSMVASTNLNVIHARLLASKCPDYTLTKPLAKLAAKGYATPEWHNRKVSMVCLKAEHNQDLFLFVMDAAELRNAPATGEIDFARILHLNSASWTAGGKIYILAGPDDGSELKRYLD